MLREGNGPVSAFVDAIRPLKRSRAPVRPASSPACGIIISSTMLITPLLKLLAHWLPALPFDGLWPLLLGNAGVLGLTLINAQADKGLFHATALSLGAGLGFWLVLSLFSDLRERTADNDIPLPFRGLPILLIGAGLMAVAFLGFSGLIKT